MTRLLPDVNAAAIALVDSHPGHRHVLEALRPALRGRDELLVYSYLPLRVEWILTSQWDLDRDAARAGVRSLLDQPLRIVDADAAVLEDAYRIASERTHDVYDSFLLALARAHDADAIVTTDTDFDRLCAGGPVEYRNPVPEDVLARFESFDSP